MNILMKEAGFRIDIEPGSGNGARGKQNRPKVLVYLQVLASFNHQSCTCELNLRY